MINMVVAPTVLLCGKVLGGIKAVTAPTLMVCTSEQQLDLRKELTGAVGKVTDL
jgi:hypothetical protein